ncbi:MAG: MarR family transcriptional regulator [Bacteroidetes bacterium]|nr:MarR family transcriptional regulator [Bacteroidota bacterium]
MPNATMQLAADLRAVLSRMIKKLRKESATSQQLSLTERSTMGLLYQHKELLPSELASMEKITNQSMSQIVGHLSELGYVNRKTSDADKRKVFISLTENGEKTLLQMRSERAAWLARAIMEKCTSEEEAVLRRAIDILAKMVDFE